MFSLQNGNNVSLSTIIFRVKLSSQFLMSRRSTSNEKRFLSKKTPTDGTNVKGYYCLKKNTSQSLKLASHASGWVI